MGVRFSRQVLGWKIADTSANGLADSHVIGPLVRVDIIFSET
jgi:hypothetical protein